MKIGLTLIPCLPGWSGVQAQEPAAKPPVIWDSVMSDVYGDILWSDEKARLDNVVTHNLEGTGDTVMYLVSYGGRRACVGEARTRALRATNYLVNRRGLPPHRVVWIDGGYRERREVEVWVLPRNQSVKYLASPTVDKIEVRFKHCRPKNKLRRKRGKSVSRA